MNKEVQSTGEGTERYGSMSTWSRETGISRDTISKYIEGAPFVIGKTSEGVRTEFFAESVFRERYKHLLADVPEADDYGFFEKQTDTGELLRYGTKLAWAQLLQVSQTTIQYHLKDKQGIDGKNRVGGLEKGGFFSEEDLKESNPEIFLQKLLQVDDGFAYDQKDGSLLACQKFAERRVRNIEGIRGINLRGKVGLFYPETIFFRFH